MYYNKNVNLKGLRNYLKYEKYKSFYSWQKEQKIAPPLQS